MKEILLGVGTLTWRAQERRTDRYGCVYLIPDGHNSLTSGPSTSLINTTAANAAVGFSALLIAKVLQTRNSTHIGDLFRKLTPRTPQVGTEIVLGEGTVFTEAVPEGGLAVGVIPTDQRDCDWLNPRALYDAHEQTVELVLRLPEQV